MAAIGTPTPTTTRTTERRSGFQITENAAERYERAVAAFMLGWSADLVERGRPQPGERVVDLACGTGFVARVAAEAIGRRDAVVGVDVNPAMVAEARRVTGLEIREASADATGLPTAAFDLVLCQQGLQYVPDPGAVLDEARRLLRPGGRVALSVWSDFDRNPFRTAQLEAMAPHLPDGAGESFRTTTLAALGGVEGFAARLRTAGFHDVAVTEVERLVELPPMADYFPLLISATPWATAFGSLRAPERRAVIERVEADVVRSDVGCQVTMTVAVATAEQPAPNRRHEGED